MRRILAGAALAMFAICIGAVLYAPYLPRLLYEGYPSLDWPARGTYVKIDGMEPPSRLISSSSMQPHMPIPALQKRMDERDGTALLIYRKGMLLTEYYAPGYSSDSRFNSFSMAKTLVGALMFKAVADGRLANLDVPIGQVLPDVGNDSMRQVSLRALLQMRSGVLFSGEDKLFGGEDTVKDINAGRINPFGPMARLHMTGLEPIKRSLVVEGHVPAPFSYQNVNSSVLGAVLEAIYARPLQVILSDMIWKPAGAQTAYWRQPAEGMPVSAYCCIYATARDWIRAGIFLSQNGKRDAPFLPEKLWREFMGLDLETAALQENVYGHHINHNILDRPGEPLQGAFSYMLGSGGQVTYMMPQEDFIVVRLGYGMQLLHSTLYEAWRSVTPAHEPSAARATLH